MSLFSIADVHDVRWVTESLTVVDKGGEGVENCLKMVDKINGRPFTKSVWC